MRYASIAFRDNASSIIAIEEPEAHLHNKAIHDIRNILFGLSDKNQVIITSHSPLFVNPSVLSSTIVVDQNIASPAKSIDHIRSVLGVRLYDNLHSARVVALVEGECDQIVVSAIFKARYPSLKASIDTGDLRIENLQGAGKLSQAVRTFRISATLVQCLLDYDDSGKRAVKDATEGRFITNADYNYVIVDGKDESELEDILEEETYKDRFFLEFGVNPTTYAPGTKKQKWSSRMHALFKMHGKDWNDDLKKHVKAWLANLVAEKIDDYIIEKRMAPIDAFATSISLKLGHKT